MVFGDVLVKFFHGQRYEDCLLHVLTDLCQHDLWYLWSVHARDDALKQFRL